MVDSAGIERRLKDVVTSFNLHDTMRILDIGCGTGVMTRAIAASVPGPTIFAMDYAESMIGRARQLCFSDRVFWSVSDVSALPFKEDSMDAVICFSAWPHFSDPRRAAREIRRVLIAGGVLHILHTQAREVINSIHEGAGGPIGLDLLPTADELSGLFESVGFHVASAIDNATMYRISAVKPP